MRGFDTTEYKERIKKARELMKKSGMEMLLITSPQNFRYFTGLDSYFWESPTRPWFVLISLNNDLNRSSNCPRNLAPAINAPISSEISLKP